MHAVPNRKCAAQCLGATRRQVFAHVVVPATVPYIVTGLRQALRRVAYRYAIQL